MLRLIRVEFGLIGLLVATLLALTSGLSVAVGQSGSDLLNKQIEQDHEHLEGVEGEIQSIDGKTASITKMTAEAERKRRETEEAIKKLSAEANGLLPVLAAKNNDYAKKRQKLKDAILLDYQSKPADAFSLMVSDGSITEAFSRSSYLANVERRFDEIAVDAGEAADAIHDKKQDLDAKKSTLEVLRRQLAALERNIVEQKTELAELRANKANEANYLASRIDRAKRAQEELLKGTSGDALWGVYTEGARVKQNDIIGFEGSTGFSTGCHTHFSVIENGQWVNPGAFWTMLRTPGGGTSQPYGMTDWARTGAYGGGIHNGIDFIQGCGAPVRAAADGAIIRDNRTDGSGFGHYIMIRHDNGLITLYGHLI